MPPSEPRTPHAAIIGGGPAGSICAFHLARAGWRTTLLERSPFPRVKVCGEFVSPAATSLLEAVIPASQLLAAGARRIDRASDADERATRLT